MSGAHHNLPDGKSTRMNTSATPATPATPALVSLRIKETRPNFGDVRLSKATYERLCDAYEQRAWKGLQEAFPDVALEHEIDRRIGDAPTRIVCDFGEDEDGDPLRGDERDAEERVLDVLGEAWMATCEQDCPSEDEDEDEA